MKTRILSLVLAVIMVVSLAAVFSVASSADEMGITVTVGTTYAAAGSDASVDFYISAKALPETHHHLRNWQFELNTELEVVEKSEYGAEELPIYVSAGAANWFANKSTKNVGNSSDTGADVGTATQLQYRGGWKVASLKFEVPEGAAPGTEYAIDVASVVNLVFEGSDHSKESQVDEKANANLAFVPGKVIVVSSVDGIVPAVAGEGEDYAIESLVDDVYYTKATKANKLTGEFGTLVIPASVTSIAGAAINSATIDKIVLKGTYYDKAFVGPLVEKADTAVYYHKRANQADTTYASLADYIENDSENEPELINLLQVFGERKTVTIDGVEREAITFGITANDVDYDSLTVVVTAGGKTKEIEVTGIYKTVKGIATTKESVAETNSDYFYLEDFTYIASVAIKNLPANATVTLYGVTADFNGNPIVVCSDTVTV